MADYQRSVSDGENDHGDGPEAGSGQKRPFVEFEVKKPKRAFSLAVSGDVIDAAEQRPTNPDTFEGKEELLRQKREQARRQAGHDLIQNYANPDQHMRQWEVSSEHFNVYF